MSDDEQQHEQQHEHPLGPSAADLGKVIEAYGPRPPNAAEAAEIATAFAARLQDTLSGDAPYTESGRPADLETLQAAMADYADLESDARPYLTELAAQKAIVVELAMAVADAAGGILKVERSGLTVTYRKPSMRRTWNTQGLMGYAVAQPDVMQFLTEKLSKPSIALKVAK